MKLYERILPFIFLFGLQAQAASDFRSLTCQVYGCTTDTVSLWVEPGSLGMYEFNFDENIQSDYPLNYDFTLALRDAKLIGENDRADHVTIAMEKKDCAEARDSMGDLTCKGQVKYGSIRVRANEQYLSGNDIRRQTFTHKTLSPTEEYPWGFELRVLPGDAPAETKWAVVLTFDGKSHTLNPFVVNQCRYSF